MINVVDRKKVEHIIESVNDGKSQWIYLVDMNEVQIMNHDTEDNMMSPSKLFTINEEDYKYTFAGAKSENGKRIEIIDLFLEKSNSFIKVQVQVDAAKNQLHQIILFDKNGGKHTYLVTSFKSNTNIKPFALNLADYKDAEVIDLR